jgi:micrococcal nuclease
VHSPRSPFVFLFAMLFVAGCASASAAATTSPTLQPIPTPPATLAATLEPSPTAPPTPAFGTAPIGPTELAMVLSITDGDTIRIDRGHGSERLRYIGMNTPEAGEPGGSEATAANTSLVAGRQVVLERDVSETDQFDRLLRYVWIQDGGGWTFVNMKLVAEGFAQAATYPPDVRFSELFVGTEQTARSTLAGLWAATPEPTLAPVPTAAPLPIALPAPTKAASNCHPSYKPCLPIVDDLNCPDVRALGLAPVQVIGPDDYRLDANHDGVGCE